MCILKSLSSRISLSDDINLEYFAETCEDFTGADFKALLYNAQLEAIHEFTSASDDSGDTDTARFGMKSKAGLSDRLKSRGSKLKVDVKKVRIEVFSCIQVTSYALQVHGNFQSSIIYMGILFLYI